MSNVARIGKGTSRNPPEMDIGVVLLHTWNWHYGVYLIYQYNIPL